MSEKAGANKEVVYIDADDEITGIIDKVSGSSSKIVALVLPKRAAVLQSVVNMKLLKRSADSAKKNLVLITSEAGLMPLAGSVGVYVAKSLQSKPEIPEPQAGGPDAEDEEEEITDHSAEEEQLDKTKPVGELAGAAAAEDAIDFDNSAEGSKKPGDKSFAKGKDGKNSKLKIPNFSRFRLLIILGSAGLVALIILGFVCFSVLPKATVSIKTDSEAVTSSTVLTLKTASSTQLDVENSIVPARSQQVQKTISQQSAASGQQNNGEKAAGTVTIKNCGKDSKAITIPSGSGVVSSGNTYITQSTIALSDANFDGSGNCKSSGSHIASVNVVAQQAGAKYNISANSNYTIAGYSGLTASGGDMVGGTDNIVKIVTQADIDSATQKIASQDTTAVKQELKTGLKNAGYMPIEATFSSGAPQTKTSVNANEKADNVTVTQIITYTMLGAKENDLKKIVAKDVDGTIDTNKQSITDYGLNNATFGLQSQSADSAEVTMQTTVVAGPDLNSEDIKKQVAGKKAATAKELIKNNPGVTDVTVKYSPFWVSSIPKKTSKITVVIEKPTKTTQSSSTSDASSN